MSPEAVFSINNGFLLLICGLFSLIVPFNSAQQRSSKSEEFSCPEDFGYYPHPSDCSQYFVCVFGDPLLESCTGGLMYSHDLRTCDWPRNVGCGVTAAASSKSENIGLSGGNINSGGRQHTTTSWRQEIPEPQSHEIPDKNLYEEEDLGPAEEVETDRQQRVYRGQPPTLGQVARDRDGIIRHANALQTSSGIEKVKPIAVVSFGSHHQSLSKGNSTNSLRFEPYTEDLDDLTKLETNRIKRDLTTRGENNEIQMANETIRSTGGYALRYRPLQSDATNSNDNNPNIIIDSESATSVNASNEPHYTSTINTIQTLSFIPNKNSNRYTPTLIKLPSSKSRRPSHNIVSKHRILTTTTTTTTQRSLIHSNPLSASSSLFHHYSDSSNSFSHPGHRYAYPIDDSPVATDFTIVNVVPKSQSAASNMSPVRPNIISPLQHYSYPQPQPSILHHYADLNPFPHMPKPPPPALHPFPVRHLGQYPHPYYYNQNYINHYAGPLVTPQMYPWPNNRFVHYSETEPSIVTLSYPKPTQNPVDEINMLISTAPSIETTTKPVETTTNIQNTSTIDTNTTNRTEEKPSNASETKIQETKTKHKPHPEDSSEVDDDPDFNSNDETDADEAEDTDKDEEEFEKIYFQDDKDDASEINKTNHNIPEIKYSAKKQTTTTDKPNKISNNDELDGGYSFSDKEVSIPSDDKDKSEEYESPADEQVEYTEIQEEDDEGNEMEEEEKDKGAEMESQNADETLDDDVDVNDESVKKDQDHLIKPAMSYYNSYLTDHNENPFMDPDFDFHSYLSDLTKPQKLQKETIERLRHKAAQIADRMDKMDPESMFKHIQKRSANVNNPSEVPLHVRKKRNEEINFNNQTFNSSKNDNETNKINQINVLGIRTPLMAKLPAKIERQQTKTDNDSNYEGTPMNANISSKNISTQIQNESKENIQNTLIFDSAFYDQYLKDCYKNLSSLNFKLLSQLPLQKYSTQGINSSSSLSFVPINRNSTEELYKIEPKQNFKNRRRRQNSNYKKGFIIFTNDTTGQKTEIVKSPIIPNVPTVQRISVNPVIPTAENQKTKKQDSIDEKSNKIYPNLKVAPQNIYRKLDDKIIHENNLKNNHTSLTTLVSLPSDKYNTTNYQKYLLSNNKYRLYLLEPPEYLKYLPLSSYSKKFENATTNIDQEANINVLPRNEQNQSRSNSTEAGQHVKSNKDKIKYIGAVDNKILLTRNTWDLLNTLKMENITGGLILMKVEYNESNEKPQKDHRAAQRDLSFDVLPETINEAFKDVNINKEWVRKGQDHLIVPTMSHYNRYITDQYENSFTNPNFDFRSYPLYPPKFKNHHLQPILRNLSRTITRRKPTYQQAKNYTKSNTTNSTEEVQLSSQKENHVISQRRQPNNNGTSMSSNRQLITPRAKMQLSSAQLIPLALLHTYSPANHSYLHKRLRIPTTKNFYQKPIDFGTSYFKPNKFDSILKSEDDEALQPPSALTSLLKDHDDTDNNEEEDEEDDTNQNEDNENGDEYYDDYAEEYTDDKHLEQPLSKPEVPSIPDRIKNIDKEVFGEKYKNEEEQQTDDGGNLQDDGEEEEQDDSGNENEEATKNDDEDEQVEDGKYNEESHKNDNENGQNESGNEDEYPSQQKQDDGTNEEEYEEEEEGDNNESGKYRDENSGDEEEQSEPKNYHNENAETVSLTKKIKQPKNLHTVAPQHVDQVMTPHHRQNKYLQRPLPSLSTYLLPPKPFAPNLQAMRTSTLRFRSTTPYPPSERNSTSTNSTPSPKLQRKPNEHNEKLKPTTTGIALKVQSNLLKTNGDKKFSPVSPNPQYAFSSNLPKTVSITNSQLQNLLTYNIPAHNPPFRVEQRNKTTAITSKGKSINEHLNKNYAYYNTPSVNGISLQTASKSKRPLSSVPSYIVEDSQSSVPTTSKSIYNVTKIDPFYSIYDENQEIYRNSEIDQFHKQRKQPTDFQIIQDSHRLQPHTSQSLNSPTIYTNQNYRQQSEIDGESQQSDKLISSKLFVDSFAGASARPPIDKSLFTNPFTPKTTNLNPPVVELQPPYTDNTRSTLSQNPTTHYTYERVQSQELEYRTEDAHLGETSYSPKVTPYLRKFPSTPITPTTPKQIRGISFSKGNFILSPDNFPSRDHFRIVVESVAGAKNNITLPKITAPITSPQPTTIEFKVATNKLQLADKFPINTFRSSNASPLQTFTQPSLSMVATSTTSTTLAKATNTPGSENDVKLNSRRFYIPKTNSVERKLHFNYETTTNTNNLGLGLQRADSLPTTKHQPQPPKLLDARADHLRAPNSKLTPPAPPTSSSSGSTEKLPPSNEVLYYDEDLGEEIDDYEDVETSENVDSNYIDNKIVDYTSSTGQQQQQQQQQSQQANQTPKITTTKTYDGQSPPHPSTNVNGPPKSLTSSSPAASSTRNPYEFVKTRLKEAEISTKRSVDRLKDVTTADRCPQCNEKPFVRGRNRGSVTYSPGGNEFVEGVTASAGRSRPTLKPSTSIVSKAEAVDIYKYAPKRPDNVYPTPQPDKVAAKCRKDICLLPDCSCGGKDIPGDLTPEETPQMVLLTFDDSVNELNRGLYVDLFEKGRVNPNGCPIAATFYVSHEWTDYSMVQNLYAAGHEIASHSVSHSFGEQFSQRKWTKEIVGQREILSAYGGVRQEDIRGMRAPFLAVGGNKMFKMLYDANFTYDSSMPIYENRPPSWPYTLDYKLFHDCMIPPCPTRSYPGVWEIPMVMWQDLNGGRCSMGDACSNPPTADGVYKMLIKNFERHFSTNRAPFGLFYHSSWFTQPHHKEGFMAFLDTIVNMPEVWLVTNWQVVQWVRDPTPISRLNKFSPFNCDYPERPRRCNNAKVCNLWHKSGVRYLKTCQACPDVYPWTGKTGVRNSRIDIEEPPSTD